MAQGLTESAATHDYRIVGGDLNRGATLSLTTTVIGATATPPLRRDGAKIGDDIWISGDLGGAAHAVNTRLLNYPLAEEKAMTQAWQKLHRPTPRLPLGLALNGLATAAMDLSDGLIKTLREIGEASGVSPHIHLENLPAAPSLTALPTAARHHCLLAGGDDYEILFTAPPLTTARHHPNRHRRRPPHPHRRHRRRTRHPPTRTRPTPARPHGRLRTPLHR